MNMVDVKKVHRGILFWREDVIKCEKCLKTPLSLFVRNLVHEELSKYELPSDGKTMLQKQIEMAYCNRRSSRPRSGSGRAFVSDVIEIPSAVKKRARFVKG